MIDGQTRPLGARVMIKHIQVEETETFGIIIPDSAKEKPQNATVVRLGKKSDGGTFDVSVGDTILVPKFGVIDMKVGGVDYGIINECDILAVISEAK